MKKKNSKIFSLFFVIVMTTILNSCTTFNGATTDTSISWDSVSQVKSGRPNDGGEFSTTEAVSTAVSGAMIEGIANPKLQSSDLLNGTPQIHSIMRIPGSLSGVLINPSSFKNLIITITRKDNTQETHILSPKSARDICLPPGNEEYTIKYSQVGHQDWIETNYSVTIAKFSSVSLTKGLRYEKLKAGSMEEYEPTTLLSENTTVDVRFAFIGWDR